MGFSRAARSLALAAVAMLPAGCGGFGSFASGPFSGGGRAEPAAAAAGDEEDRLYATRDQADESRSTIADLFRSSADPNVTVAVNRYLWRASLDVLNFLPIETVDPFTGVIVTGYGTPPGGGRAYRATVYVQDPALDARSLRVALQARGGGAVGAGGGGGYDVVVISSCTGGGGVVVVAGVAS
jgi:hypothetical protein